MSTWDQCCKGGKFNPNFSKTQRTAETFRKIDGPKVNEASAFPETPGKSCYSHAFASKKNEDLAAIKNVTYAETQFSFLDLGLNNYLLKWIESLRFPLPNRVQNEVLYCLSEKKSKYSIIIAPKKSGKTSAALLWVLNELCDKNKNNPKALMICPTFETADATYRFVEQVPDYCSIKIYPAMKGKKLNEVEQVSADLIIATPDKALELSNSAFVMKKAKYLIFDDVHCMSDTVGHLKILSHICSLLASRCCIILCTLFCNKMLNDFIDEFLLPNQRIEIENVLTKVLPKEIFIVYSNNEERNKALLHLEKNNFYKGQTVIFCKTKDEAVRLKMTLDAENSCVEILNGNLKPPKRSIILKKFKENKIKLLITTYAFTEVLEAENVTKVINYEQVLNSEFKLNRDIYGQIENLLNDRKNCLIGSFIEQKWEDTLLHPQPGYVGEEVYPNATRISANDLIDGQKF